MANRKFNAENYVKVLASDATATYTQVWDTPFSLGERVIYILYAQASCNVLFNVQLASDSSGTGATTIGTNVTANSAGKVYTIEVTPNELTSTLQYISPIVTFTAGTYTLIRIVTRLRNEGQVVENGQDATYASAQFLA